jgi:hypothetical protein
VGKNKKLATIIFSAIAVWSMAACQRSEVANGSANTSANKAAANTANISNTAAATSGSVDLSTPTAAYKTAYNARKNKDIATLKKTMSKDAQDFLTEIGKADDSSAKSLDDMLTELCKQPQAPTAEARNEKITGDKATIEYLDETGSWNSMDLVKENGEWKLTIGKADEPPMEDTKGSNKGKDKK